MAAFKAPKPAAAAVRLREIAQLGGQRNFEASDTPALNQPAPITLRQDQREVLEALRVHLRGGIRKLLLRGATGFGKTVLTAFMLGGACEKGIASLFIVHRRELVRQASATFSAVGIDHGIIAAGFDPDRRPLVQIASIATLQHRGTLPDVRLLIWDEAHHVGAAGWARLKAAYPGAFHIGLTATPMRLDGSALDFDQIVCAPTERWLMDRGLLVPVRHYAPTSVHLDGVRIRMGDYVKSDVAAVLSRSPIARNAVKAVRKYAPGRRVAMFSISVAASKAMVARFNAAGIPADHVDGETPARERDAAIDRFERGRTLVLGNVDLFGEGFDLPALEAVLMLRPTASLTVHMQQIGRALRPAPGKSFATVLDLVGNWQRHGLVDAAREWTLGPRKITPGSISPAAIGLQACPECALVNSPRPTCEACGAPIERPASGRAPTVDPELARRLQAMSYREAVRFADSPEKAALVAAARGFKRGWVFHRIRELRATEEGPGA